jgi:hypothetical protein
VIEILGVPVAYIAFRVFMICVRTEAAGRAADTVGDGIKAINAKRRTKAEEARYQEFLRFEARRDAKPKSAARRDAKPKSAGPRPSRDCVCSNCGRQTRTNVEECIDCRGESWGVR